MTNLLDTQSSHGFSLVEALVAIAILLTVVSGVMMLIDQSIRTGEDVSNRLAASYLASDAIEYLRYDRDSNWLSDNNDSYQDWLDSIPDPCKSGNKCQIDTRAGEGSITPCSGDCSKLQYNTSEHVYGYESGSNWEASKYTRAVKFIQINDVSSQDSSDDEAIVQVTVTWPKRTGKTSDLVLTDTLSSWGD